MSSALAMQPSPSEASLEAGPSSEITELVASLKVPVPSATPYVEARFSKMLKKPMQLRGELRYEGFGTLGKRVEAPYQEITTIANGTVEVKREGRSPQQFSLSRSPELSALIVGISGILGGDATELYRHFAIVKSGGTASWRLILRPRSPQLAKQLEDLIVDGGNAGIHCITMREADGDSSVMRLGAFANFQIPSTAPAKELEKLCQPSLPLY
ncbi:MAG: outer membrane lipoprotein carrier protein LolA [Rudaea sp.]|uniref:LolA-related protein n=1 Tax=unclassified Rudaea TaxID=2627037 RepID=UPI0010F62BD1|nr:MULTISPECIES: LolA-related protein [unclassified Rudaea]MBN8885287.1 outer membrane lipoprotein carrier protein LolA [Rudaea sp.]